MCGISILQYLRNKKFNTTDLGYMGFDPLAFPSGIKKKKTNLTISMCQEVIVVRYPQNMEIINKTSDNSIQIEDNFKKKFKYYKSNKPKPSFRDVIIVDVINDDKVTNVTPFNAAIDPRGTLLGLQKQSLWRKFVFRDHPGLILIRNPFTNAGQRYWIQRCLEEYSKKPNKRNIDIERDVQDWWSECFKDGECNRVLQKKLRWTTLGYHHNWDTKVYNNENRTPFPEDLSELSDVVAQYLGYTNFKAEAAIVNYYHMDSTLSAHTDHSEVNLEAPLFSFSFGQSAIFLLGGKDKSTEPSAILLQSGDIVIMSKESRLCYHAVPRILPAESSPWNQENLEISPSVASFKYLSNPNQLIALMKKCMDNDNWNQFDHYIEESRVNMNVRQVLNDSQISVIDQKFNNR